MNKNIKIIYLALISCILLAGIASASIEQAETGSYSKQEGKKLIFYGDSVITKFHIRYWNFDNASHKHEETDLSLNTTTYVYEIYPPKNWNATYIRWEATIHDSFGDVYRFEGGFSMTGPLPINLSGEFQNISDDLKSWFIQNESINDRYDNLNETIITEIDSLLGNYNEGIVSELKTIGLTDNQITEIMTSVSDGFQSTLRSKEEQEIKVEQARDDAFWNGVKLVSIFIFVAIAVFGFSLYVKRDSLDLPQLFSLTKKPTKQSDSSDMDIFDL